MRCILDGHVPVERAGVGEFEGLTVIICAYCGNVLSEANKAPSAAESNRS